MNGYELSRTWFNWCFENQGKIKPNHTALYFFCVEHCNRMGWVKNFSLPTEMAKSAIGINSYNTYSNTLKELVEWGFINIVKKSNNQYSANVIALSYFDKALDKALDKASIKHVTKQVYSTYQSIDSINKHITINNEPISNDVSNLINSLKYENENLKKIINEQNNFNLGENNSQKQGLSPFTIQPARPISDFIGEISADGKVI